MEAAFELQPDHFSCYQLTVEPRTSFGFRHQRGHLVELSTEKQAERFISTHELLEEHGFAAYEVSNFATSSHHQSRHNQKYWNHTPYLGLGPSAVSTIQGKRWKNLPDTARYIHAIESVGHAMSEAETIDNEAFRIERIALLLRTTDGLPTQYLSTSPKGAVQELIDNQLAEINNGHLRLINDGPMLVDPIAGKLL